MATGRALFFTVPGERDRAGSDNQKLSNARSAATTATNPSAQPADTGAGAKDRALRSRVDGRRPSRSEQCGLRAVVHAPGQRPVSARRHAMRAVRAGRQRRRARNR
jgi:hypothetical protein